MEKQYKSVNQQESMNILQEVQVDPPWGGSTSLREARGSVQQLVEPPFPKCVPSHQNVRERIPNRMHPSPKNPHSSHQNAPTRIPKCTRRNNSTLQAKGRQNGPKTTPKRTHLKTQPRQRQGQKHVIMLETIWEQLLSQATCT